MKKITKTGWLKIILAGAALIMASLSFANFGDGSKLLFADASAEEKPLRLHVLANSDSEEDQRLKLQVRDFIIKELEPQLSMAESKEEAMSQLAAELPELTELCNDFLADKSDYQATVELERADFPQIDYNGLVFASGEYDALRIVLGEGQGHNWWCVLFPPLCFVDLAAEVDDQAMAVWAPYDDEVSSDTVSVRWKLSELFSR